MVAVIPVSGRKPRAILSLLAVRAGRVVAAEELIDALWGERPPPTARKAVQTHVWTVRSALPQAIESVPGGYRCPLEPEAVDALQFERMIAAAGVADPAAAADLLTTALRLWRGRPLPDLADHGVGAAEAVRLVELRMRAEDELGEHRLVLGGGGELIADLERAVRDEPLRERRWAVLITALYRAGRQADALRAAQRLRRRLSEELGLDPSPALRRLEAAVLAQSPSLLAARPAHGSVPRCRRAPAPARLVGRSDVVAELSALLADRRLVTLTGPGGVGKSSVAAVVVEATSAMFPDGVAWADLSVLEPGGDVVRVVSDAFGVSGELGAPALEALTRAVEGRRLLLVADNCEHVLDGVVTVVEALLDTVVLCTSREPLGIAAEHVVVLPPLGFDDASSPAVELLRARLGPHAGSEAEVTTLVDLAAQLDGLPLALELAAARCRSLGVADVRRRLAGRLDLLADRRRPARHRSLDATLSWSYDLLRLEEAVVLQRLSVFAGSFGLDAAERVAEVRRRRHRHRSTTCSPAWSTSRSCCAPPIGSVCWTPPGTSLPPGWATAVVTRQAGARRVGGRSCDRDPRRPARPGREDVGRSARCRLARRACRVRPSAGTRRCRRGHLARGRPRVGGDVAPAGGVPMDRGGRPPLRRPSRAAAARVARRRLLHRVLRG